MTVRFCTLLTLLVASSFARAETVAVEIIEGQENFFGSFVAGWKDAVAVARRQRLHVAEATNGASQ